MRVGRARVRREDLAPGGEFDVEEAEEGAHGGRRDAFKVEGRGGEAGGGRRGVVLEVDLGDGG